MVTQAKTQKEIEEERRREEEIVQQSQKKASTAGVKEQIKGRKDSAKAKVSSNKFEGMPMFEEEPKLVYPDFFDY